MVENLNLGKLDLEKYTPQDKSWVIRMGILDLTRGYTQDIINFLDSQDQTALGSDLKALRRIAGEWHLRYSKPLNVGESGTIYRFVKFYNWLNNIPHEPIVSDTLQKRSREEITNDSSIVHLTPEILLTLDNNTTQWATMQYLLLPPALRKKVAPIIHHGKTLTRSGDFKLRVTYDAVSHWEEQRKEGKCWESRIDPTFFAQQKAFVDGLKTGKVIYTGEQAEDYCFERAFDLITQDEGSLVYPSVEGHETNRIEEMEKVIAKLNVTGIIDSPDHRVVQAMVMRQIFLGKPYTVANPNVVNKTWPKYWEFIKYVNENN